jgi:hypothetical protein
MWDRSGSGPGPHGGLHRVVRGGHGLLPMLHSTKSSAELAQWASQHVSFFTGRLIFSFTTHFARATSRCRVLSRRNGCKGTVQGKSGDAPTAIPLESGSRFESSGSTSSWLGTTTYTVYDPCRLERATGKDRWQLFHLFNCFADLFSDICKPRAELETLAMIHGEARL